MRRITEPLWILILLVPAGMRAHAQRPNDSDLLRTREAVWRAWFNNDQPTLTALVPKDTITISAGQQQWQHHADVLKSAADFHARGGKLLRLSFPHTEVQHFGNVAITYSTYTYEIEIGSQRTIARGRATEVFVRRNGRWTNPGWHTDEEH